MICNDFHSSPMSPVNQNRCPTNLPGTANERMILSCGIMISPLPWVLIPRTAPGICGRDRGFYMASSNTWFFSHIHKGLGNPNIQSIGIKEAAFVQQPFAPQDLHVVFAWKVTYNLFDLFSVRCREHKMSALQPAKPQTNPKIYEEIGDKLLNFNLKLQRLFGQSNLLAATFSGLPISC